MRRSQPQRDNRDAQAKCQDEGECRVCKIQRGLEMAHLAKRIYDKPKNPGTKRLYVHPDNVIPLCKHDHEAFDAGDLDVLEYLTDAEQLHVVKVMRGIEPARVRLAPLDYRRDICDARVEARLAA